MLLSAVTFALTMSTGRAVTPDVPGSAVPSSPDTGSVVDSIANSMPELTLDAVQKMMTFVTHFMQEPDSIKQDAFTRKMSYVLIVGNQEKPGQGMDMVAVATKYPSVAADLNVAGLSALEWQAYRSALNSASMTYDIGFGPYLKAGSMLARNVAFFKEHRDKIKELEFAGMGLSHMSPSPSSKTTDDDMSP